MTNKQTILVATHQQPFRNLLAKELTPAYDLVFAADGVEAIRTHERYSNQIATIVIEHHLPKLSGCVVTEWLHHILPELPVIIVNDVIDDEIQELLEHPAVTFVQEPAQLMKVKTVLQNVLHTKSIALARH
jgi:CheY-like chemotaxis protein